MLPEPLSPKALICFAMVLGTRDMSLWVEGRGSRVELAPNTNVPSLNLVTMARCDPWLATYGEVTPNAPIPMPQTLMSQSLGPKP